MCICTSIYKEGTIYPPAPCGPPGCGAYLFKFTSFKHGFSVLGLLVCLLLACLIALYLNWLVVVAPWINIFTLTFACCLSSRISSKSSQNEPAEPKTQGRPRWHPRLPKPLQIHEASSPRTSGSYFWCYFVDLRFWTTVQRIWWFFRFLRYPERQQIHQNCFR